MDATGINRMKDKNHLADHHNRSRKGFDKIQHFLMIKRVKKKKKKKKKGSITRLYAINDKPTDNNSMVKSC